MVDGVAARKPPEFVAFLDVIYAYRTLADVTFGRVYWDSIHHICIVFGLDSRGDMLYNWQSIRVIVMETEHVRSRYGL